MLATKRSLFSPPKSSPGDSLKQSENGILAALPEDVYQSILPDLRFVHLRKGTILYDAGDQIRDCYFPLTGMISLRSATDNNKTVEIAMVGSDALAGIAPVLQMNAAPYQEIVEIESSAMQIRTGALKASFEQGGKLRQLLLRSAYRLLCQITLSAGCNRFHTVEQRLCRWLLVTADTVKSDAFPLTQESIAQVLGTPRTNVSMIATPLAEAGLIGYKRGRITILDRERLKEAACHCYRIDKNQSSEIYQ